MITSIERAEQLEGKKRSHASGNSLVLIPIAETEQGRVGSTCNHLGQQGLVILNFAIKELKGEYSGLGRTVGARLR